MGVTFKWKKAWWPRQGFCKRGIITESKKVSLSDMQGAYYLFGIILGLAITALTLEKGIMLCCGDRIRKARERKIQNKKMEEQERCG